MVDVCKAHIDVIGGGAAKTSYWKPDENKPQKESGESDWSSIEIYPNPAEDVLNIKGGNSGFYVRVLNILGMEVYQGEMNTELTISVEDWNKGIFIIEVFDPEMNRVYFEKVLIN